MAASLARRERAYLSRSYSKGYLFAFPFSLFLNCARKGRSSLRFLVNFSGSGRRSDLVDCAGAVEGARGLEFEVLVVDGFGV